MYWETVLDEIMNKDKIRQFSFIPSIDKRKAKRSIGNKQKGESYKLGDNFPGIKFSQREAECMRLLLKGKTMKQVAACVKLSPRTVEFYVRNMKAKVGCRTKGELIDVVLQSDFLKQCDLF